jgi:hypothetical protein
MMIFWQFFKSVNLKNNCPKNWKFLPDFGTTKLVKKKIPAYGQKNQPSTLILGPC